MNPDFNSEDWYYEKLYETIMQSITDSDAVKKVFEEGKVKGVFHRKSIMNLILSLEEISELFKTMPRRSFDDNDKKLDFHNLDSDEVRWLKQARIKF